MVTTTSSVHSMDISFEDSQPPTQGRLYVHNRTREVMVSTVPGQPVPYIVMSNSDHEFPFNPTLHLSSPTNASSFISGVIAAAEPGAGPEVADRIATFAFGVVSGHGWVSGLSMRVNLHTTDVFFDHEVLGFEEDDEMDDEGFGSYDSSESLGGMSERELCMLRMEQFTGDEGECCICLEGFMEGAMITPLAPCSHSFEDSQPPTQGRLYVHNRIREVTVSTVPGQSVPYIVMSNSDHEFPFNPTLHLSSPTDAWSFMSGVIAAAEPGAGPGVADRIATFAFSVVSGRGWVSGLSMRVNLETTDVFFDHEVSGFEEDDEMDDEGFGSYDSSVSLGGMSERELCMLRREEFTGDEGECCICLEGFMEGAMITPLAPCSHRFHHSCILQWLRSNPTCPICRRRPTVPV
nr:probable E3 ubiquitin-protein ligase RHY1A [Ipomoea batatas]